MPNVVKRRQTGGSTDRSRAIAVAWLVLGSVGIVLAVLISALPSPREVFGAAPTAGISAELDRAALLAATVLIWAMVIWLAGVLLVALTARLVVGGRRGHLIVTRVAQLLLPRALRGIVVAAVGVGSVAAMTGCAPGAAAAVGAPAVTTPLPATAAAPITVDLDWPVDPPPAPEASEQAYPAAPAPTAPAAVPSAAPADVDPSGFAASADSDAGSAAAPTVDAAPPASAPAGSDAAGRTDGATSASVTSTAPIPTPATTPVPDPGPAADTPVPEIAVPSPTAPSPGPPAPAVAAPASTSVAGADVPGAAAPAPAAEVVTVARGDSLWELAAAHLPVGSSDIDIAAAWPRWYALNRAVIGDDPDHIEPGWQLTVPSDREDPRS